MMPANDVLPAEMQTAMQQTAGVIREFRDAFEQCFNQLSKPTLPNKLIGLLPPDKQSLYYSVRNTRLSSQQFSDTLLFHAPTRTLRNERTVTPLFGALFACCWSMITSLAARIPFRGGVALGVGLELAKNSFYGPALACAHHPESNCAKWPRVVIALSIPEKLAAGTFGRLSIDNGEDHLLSQMNHATANACLSLMCKDSDDQWIVDCLGEGATRIYRALGMDVDSAVASARRWVEVDSRESSSQSQPLRLQGNVITLGYATG